MLSKDSVSIGLLCPRAVVHSEGWGLSARLNITFSILLAGFDFLAYINECLNDKFFSSGVLGGWFEFLPLPIFLYDDSPILSFSRNYLAIKEPSASSLDRLLGVS